MLTLVVSALSAALAVAALGVIVSSWLRHTPAFAGLRQELAGCTDQRELRYTVREIQVRRSATVYYPDFTPERPAFRRPARLAAGQRAAA